VRRLWAKSEKGVSPVNYQSQKIAEKRVGGSFHLWDPKKKYVRGKRFQICRKENQRPEKKEISGIQTFKIKNISG